MLDMPDTVWQPEESVRHSERAERLLPACLTQREVRVCLNCLWPRMDICRLAFSQVTDIRVVVPGAAEGEHWLACFRVPSAAVRAWAHRPKQVINLHDWGVLLEARLLARAESDRLQ